MNPKDTPDLEEQKLDDNEPANLVADATITCLCGKPFGTEHTYGGQHAWVVKPKTVDADGLKMPCMYCPYCDYKPSGECQNPYKECSACAGIRSALNALLRELEGKLDKYTAKHDQYWVEEVKQILADARVGEG